MQATSTLKAPKEEEKLATNQTEQEKPQDPQSSHREEKEKSLEERLESITLTSVETQALSKVFDLLCGIKVPGCSPLKKIKGGKEELKCFNGKDIARVLKSLGMRLKKSEIDLMVWEVDENLDGCVDEREFQNMYKKCIVDKKGLEPKTMFHMVQFLMYGSKHPEQKYQITTEDTLELMFVRWGRFTMDNEIDSLFNDKEEEDEEEEEGKKGKKKSKYAKSKKPIKIKKPEFKSQDTKQTEGNTELEHSITFTEYLEKVNKRAIKQRRDRLNEKNQYNLANKSQNQND